MSSRKRRRDSSVETSDLNDDDDEVEVLWTIPPPPSRPVSRSPCPWIESKWQEAPNLGSQSVISPMNSIPINESAPMNQLEAVNDDIPMEEGRKSYSLQSSAYLQNLAEICFTLLHDLRWRIVERPQRGNKQPPTLFQWEQGDDLGVVIALSRQYITPRNEAGKMPKDRPDEHVNDFSPLDTVMHPSNNAVPPPEPTIEVRSLYLYCRLFYRKGPWFRIDDIYNKYYRPTIEETHSSTARALDELIQSHLAQFSILMADLHQLYHTGHIRFFSSEAECGRTIGEDGLLTAEERNTILRKLGAAPGKSRSTTDPVKSALPKKHPNPIWRQMSQQTKLFASFQKKTTGEPNVLPVRCHLESVLLGKLVTLIIQAVRRVQPIPKEQLRDTSSYVKNSISQLLQGKFPITFDSWCFRLREAPQITLQRAARLYVCATSGPGEMRSNGSNGWRSLQTFDASMLRNAPLAKTIPPPGQYIWHHVQYPGLSYRFGLTSAYFMDAYQPFLVSDDMTAADGKFVRVFRTLVDFQLWEVCAELRCTVDYLTELNEVLRSEERRRARGKEARHKTAASANGTIDFLSLLTVAGRRIWLQKFLQCSLHSDVEKDVEELLPAFESECEAVLVVIAILILHILAHSPPEHEMLVDRPWLRHMSWQACMALMLFDIIPILERHGLYPFAVQSLRVLLYGFSNERTPDPIQLAGQLIHQQRGNAFTTWISRRVRGKVMERLIVDCGQIHRQFLADQDKVAKKSSLNTFRQSIVQFCREAIDSTSSSSAIGFSAIRSLARRLQQPLRDILNPLMCLEAKELGLRLENTPSDTTVATSGKSGFSDWTPTTDFFLANSLNRDNNEPGGRCTFVGFEDEPEKSMLSSSLNVEELAMDLYNTGRLPCLEEGVTGTVQGGWIGWHDEGSHIRTLFRIICATDLLGMDCGPYSCGSSFVNSKQGHVEHSTVHLSPHQQAPFDLLVGYELQRCSRNSDCEYFVPSQSFYCRRADEISKFLHELASMDGEELSNFVYDSVASRVAFMSAHGRKDPCLDRDVLQVRTLSALAIGFGGKCLAAIFRCFVFDYRHYSGGLPDLHLFRATYEGGSSIENAELVDLGDWIGEWFCKEHQQFLESQRASFLLNDGNDELLGFSKASDSGGSYRKPRDIIPKAQYSENHTQTFASTSPLPERLKLIHNDRAIKVECMMVEVKSASDRLDARQEDWLNIIDQHGNARVCKLLSNKKGHSGPQLDILMMDYIDHPIGSRSTDRAT